ncbi:hypothetical protein DAETH_10000 [Deinococcus aetherius]|uniref:Uncharacterized protein n=1 Tax=Deinococcus aetherius TaxID=200252 RepID=A0ABM8ABG1_9DEIO|nr:hypothetical protein DAETH_10000 [Deinococcus aetherius]
MTRGESIQKRHSRAIVRHHRQRIIRRRLRRAYVKEWPPNRIWGWRYKACGQASKNNTVCSCGLCRAEKYRDRPRKRHHWEE